MIVDMCLSRASRVALVVTLLFALTSGSTAASARQVADTGASTGGSFSSQWFFGLGLALAAGLVAFAAAVSQRRRDELETDDR